MSRAAVPCDDSEGRRAFDFLFGRWNIANRRLREPLAGSTNWYQFESTATERPILDGLGNIEQYDAPDAPSRPIHAIALRLFNLETGEWSIYWSTAGSGTVGVPTVGRFEAGVGTFIGREMYEGRNVVVRFRWTRGNENEATWEQAFSDDGGSTFEKNWVMDFSRARD